MIYLAFVLYFTYKITLSLLQIDFIKKALKKPAVVLEQEEYEKAGKIAIFNEKFAIFSALYSFVILIFWLSFGLDFLQSKFSNSLLSSTFLVLSFFIIDAIFSLPLELYSKFVKDKKFGFSNLTFKLFLIDKIKALFLFLTFGFAFIFLILSFMAYFGKSWWIFAFILSLATILLINFIYPTFIAPLFNKMSSLQEGELKDKISALLQENNFTACPIFVLDASKRDNRLNAYFGGFGKFKRVVLFDTLINKLSINEILAVLAHEIGHFSHKDIIKNIFLMAILLFLFFAFFGNLTLAKENLGILLIYISLLSPLFFAFFEPILSYFSRKNEFEADNFSSSLQDKNDLISALQKLGSQNSAFPLSNKIYSLVYHSHPCLYERIQRLKGEN